MTNEFDGFWIGFIASYQTHINKEKISKLIKQNEIKRNGYDLISTMAFLHE